MLLKTKELEIPEDDPFKYDVLDRRESAKALTQFVLSTTDPLVLCINAPWGEGKTTFLRMWEQDLKNNDIPTISFNAWENDFSDDALVCLLGEIEDSLEKLSLLEEDSEVKKYLEKAKSIGGKLLKSSIPLGVKLLTYGLIDAKEFGLDSGSENALASFTESFAKERVQQYKASKQSIKSFRKQLKELAKSFSDKKDPKPLVFIIDELDRCRPNFSIEVLEKAKHFFNVENIIFVLGVDKKQLGSSFKAVYGEGLDIEGYLRRFIDFDYNLPKLKDGKFVKAMFNKFGFTEYFSSNIHTNETGKTTLRIFNILLNSYELTLREKESCCSLFSLAIRTTENIDDLHPILLCFLIVLKVKKQEIYNEFLSEKRDPSSLVKETRQRFHLDFRDSREMTSYLIACKSQDIEEALKKYRDLSFVDSKEIHEMQLLFLDYSYGYEYQKRLGIFHQMLNKLELISNFS